MNLFLSYFASAGITILFIALLFYAFKTFICTARNLLLALKVYNLKKYNKEEYKKYLKYKKEFLEKNSKGPLVSGLEEFNETAGVDYEILGFKEPKGKWQKFVLSRKMGYLMALREAIQENEKSGNKKMGYWQLVVRANSISRGRNSGREF